MNTTLLNHPRWDRSSWTSFNVLRLRGRCGSPWVVVYHMHGDGSYLVARMDLTRDWTEWKGLDLFAAQAVVDHIFAPRRVKLWRWLKGYFGR